ncbi:unnamed protein product [Cyprideis torosa]|uniref:Uncharacterized protein n=1 Tax=Cyprideis torosa TaxID=163714 RepID=A0A7R8W449_9CRUS|nr:unnamed protein product [Cyprideis torosa]CAG0883772.1 unnamed protein product [Cyprideis torosa]
MLHTPSPIRRSSGKMADSGGLSVLTLDEMRKKSKKKGKRSVSLEPKKPPLTYPRVLYPRPYGSNGPMVPDVSGHSVHLAGEDAWPPVFDPDKVGRASPYKKWGPAVLGPSDSIGLNFSPQLHNIRLRSERQRKKNLKMKAGPDEEIVEIPAYLTEDGKEKAYIKVKKQPPRHYGLHPALIRKMDIPKTVLVPTRKYEMLNGVRTHVLYCAPVDMLEKKKKEMRKKAQKEERKKPFKVELSPPTSPTAQLKKQREAYDKLLRGFGESTPEQIERYGVYLRTGIPDSEVPTSVFDHAKRGLEKRFQKHQKWLEKPAYVLEDARSLFLSLLEEIQSLHSVEARRAQLDYVLLDPKQCARLKLKRSVAFKNLRSPLPYIRSPVSWHTRIDLAKEFIRHNLHWTNKIIFQLRDIFQRKVFSNVCLFNRSRFNPSALPLSPEQFGRESLAQCVEAAEKMKTRWIPTAASVFVTLYDEWKKLVPLSIDGSVVQADHFFNTAATLMSQQLREIVMAALKEMLHFFQLYDQQKHQASSPVFHVSPLIQISIRVFGPTVEFEPALESVRTVLDKSIQAVLSAALDIPRVEELLFPGEFEEPMKLRHVRPDEEEVEKIEKNILQIFQENTREPLEYVKVYDQFKDLINGKAQKEIDEFIQRGATLKEYEVLVTQLWSRREKMRTLPDRVPLGLLQLDCTQANAQIEENLRSLCEMLVQHQVQLHEDANERICDQFQEMSSRLSVTPSSTNEVVSALKFLGKCTDVTMKDLKKRIQEAAERLMFLMDHATLSEASIQSNAKVFAWIEEIEKLFESAFAKLLVKREEAENSLKIRVGNFEKKLAGYQAEVESFRRRDPPILNLEEMQNNVAALDRLGSLLSESRQELDSINNEEELLDLEPTNSTLLQHLIALREPYDKLWHTTLDFTLKHERWFHGPFMGLDADEIHEDVEQMWRTLYKLSKTFSDQPGPRRVADHVRTKIDKFKQHLPVLHTICNPGLRERHWKQMSEAVGQELIVKEDTTLAMMIDFGLPKAVKKLEEISAVASKEYSLEKSLDGMKGTWANISFEFMPYRETGVSILTAVDDVQVLLDDHILKAQTMRGSPYIRALEAGFRLWEETLLSMQDILDAWLKCQGTWLYLEPIFSSEDILQQMPVEGRKFVRVDRTWRDIMGFAVEHPLALEATSQPDMLQRLQECNGLLDDIQKGLNDYLEKKRLYFPRFFFLSNEELLEILSETKDASRVQPHLRKCFEGIHRLALTEAQIITGMRSEEGEEVEFVEEVIPARARGLVERWLLEVEGVMVASLRNCTKKAVTAYSERPRSKWVLEWPGQVVLCVSNIFWTAQTIKAMESQESLKDHLSRCTGQIEDIVRLVKNQDLSSGARTTLEALLVIDVHARDIVAKLIEEGVHSPRDFTWLSQLRYSWNDYDSLVSVSMITTDIRYGYEYLGNTGRLVITPLTDRCYRTLMGALKLHLGGAPEGPAGTGKTETCKDLAKAVAKKCVVFNCSEGLDYKAMGKFIKGLAQSGAWACFDEFNRIELEVLSVVAQQVQMVQTAIAQGAPTLHFEGTTIRLDHTCSIFITMNPGYAGRQELPDNLKVLFRTVAMMVPDYALIAENSLYSYGFVSARSLAGKIVDVYRLCSEQLSAQHHYDYGMRAVKAVLTAARNLRLKYPDHDEEKLVLRAIMDVNKPKFLAQDVPLFEGIIYDLFPGVKLECPDYRALNEALDKALKERKLQSTPWFIQKIVQIYEMVLVRHGLMIVGDTMGGKTSAYQVLVAALSTLSEEGLELKVNHRVINPKAIDLGQLYGCFDKISHEWSDGVLATTFREMATSSLPDRQFLLLDGPVDAVWIENMNTVLDDNRKLCLMSGEIIQMSRQMNVIFEVADLEHASPATVSRCGMIYMEPLQLGWRPLWDSYFEEVKAVLNDEYREAFYEMTDWMVQPCLDFSTEECRHCVEVSSITLLNSFIRLHRCLLADLQENCPDAFTTPQGAHWVQHIFLFAVIWSIGATITGDSRRRFDEYFRQFVLGYDVSHPKPKTFKLQRNHLFPEAGTVYDYAFERRDNGHWVPWLDKSERKASQIPPNAKVSELLIPTNETSRQEFFLRLLVGRNETLMFIGATGTGKSIILNSYLMGLPKEKFLPNTINFSARTTAPQTQDVIMSKLDRRRKGVYGPAMGKKCIIFIDDVNMPQKEKYGAQPAVELLRQWLDHGYWYDRKDTSKLEIIDTLLVTAMCPPGGGRNNLSRRFMRHLHLIEIEPFDDPTLTRIFGSIMDWHFTKGFDISITRYSKAVVQGTLEVYKSAINTFRPTPTKSHYVFNLRDFSRVIQGILLVPANHMNESGKLVRLWVHEVMRTFHDRLIEDSDREQFLKILRDATQNNFKQTLERALPLLTASSTGLVDRPHLRKLLFGDYTHPEADAKVYNEVRKLAVEVGRGVELKLLSPQQGDDTIR